MPKLTDSQLVILSAAAGRDDRLALPLPKSLKMNSGAAATVLKSLLKKDLLEEMPAGPETPAWREEKDGGRLALRITEAGLQALDGGPGSGTVKPASKGKAASKKAAKKPAAPQKKPATTKPKEKTAAPVARPGSKQALLIDLLQRKSGASVTEISEATGWQPHSVRGAISSTLKKKLGLTVASEKVEARGRVYRIVAGAPRP